MSTHRTPSFFWDLSGVPGGNNNLDKQVQTIIHVHPHFLEDTEKAALVTCENRTQTNITVEPKDDDTVCYSSLEYIPFKDIQEHNIRVLNLPRKLCLHFSHSYQMIGAEKCLLDDDGINELCIELKERAKQKVPKASVTFVHAETQTEEVESC